MSALVRQVRRAILAATTRLVIKTLPRAAAAAALAILPLTTTTPAHAHAAVTVSLSEAVASLPLAAESREGYQRISFKHWNTGQNPVDGCNTRIICTLRSG